jgi:ribosome-associated heat shock protein Hsp15
MLNRGLTGPRAALLNYNRYMSESVRIDKWLWAARFFRTRALARDAIKGGKVQLNGTRVKPGRTLSEGDCLLIRRGEDEFEITVRDLGDRRLSAALAQEKYEEDPQSMARREAAAEQRKLDRQARAERQRRPDKRQRRQIIRFTKRQ